MQVVRASIQDGGSFSFFSFLCFCLISEFLGCCSTCISLIAFWAWISKSRWLDGFSISSFFSSFLCCSWFSLSKLSCSCFFICNEIIQRFLDFFLLSWFREFLSFGSACVSLIAFWTCSKHRVHGGSFSGWNSSWFSLNSDGGDVSYKGNESEEFHL